ncbi:biopolymer transporter ExbB [Photorhabdus cinerea]|uniref:Biopolymer transporter ExbB n=1 Tax=Photorhabdus cinerea TaxID=471575 RepID=A0A7X5TJL8_9GAMM|nr:biopolymer transporter ExbB [Photorhabdus cinerea]NHB94474.1 biopolymer transporter ExbB [Photorhabdus cinerea]
MSRKHKVRLAFILILVPYLLVILACCVFKHYQPELSFTKNREVLGAAMSSYAGTTIAILIAALTFVIGLRGRNIAKLERYGYMTSVIIMYSLSFVELGILFFTGVLLMSNLEGIPLSSIAIIIAASSFMHICFLLIQLFNFSKEQ